MLEHFLIFNQGRSKAGSARSTRPRGLRKLSAIIDKPREIFISGYSVDRKWSSKFNDVMEDLASKKARKII